MDLHVEIIGLCLLVLHRDRVHVLLPDTEKHQAHPHHPGHTGSHGGVEVHVLKVSFPGVPPRFTLRNAVLDLSKIGGSAPLRRLPEWLLDASRQTATRVPAEQLGENPRASIGARVTLPARGIMTHGMLVNWEMGDGGPIVPLTHKLDWIIPNVTSDDWRLRGLRGAGGRPPVRPNRGTSRSITLTIKHTVFPEPTPVPRYRAEHVRAYYDILGASGGAIPILYDDPSRFTSGAGRKKNLDDDGGDPFNCMLAKGDPPP